MATLLINGKLREVYSGTTTESFTTGIRITTGQLSKIRGRLFIESVVGAPGPTATASIVGGFLRITIGNSVGGTSFTWKLDIELTHSVQQALDPLAGAQIQIVNSMLGTTSVAGAVITVLENDFFTLNANMTDVPNLTIPVLAGHRYLVKADLIVAHGTSVELAIGGTATASEALLTHTIEEEGVIQNAPSPTLDPRLLAVVTKSAIGDAQIVTCPAQPGTIASTLAHWQIEGMIGISAPGNLRLRYRLPGAPSYHNQTLIVAKSTFRSELIS